MAFDLPQWQSAPRRPRNTPRSDGLPKLPSRASLQRKKAAYERAAAEGGKK